MSFEQGSISLRIFKSSPGSELPEDAVSRMAKDAVPGVDAIPVDGCSGWATGRHLLDRNINDDSVIVGGRIRATLVKAEKKIPGALFKAECRQEELATMAAKGVPYLRRSERTEIASAVRDRMLPTMPPSLAGIDVATTRDGVYATAVSDSNADLLIHSWRKTMGIDLSPYSPLAAALLHGVSSRSLCPTSFSPEIADGGAEQDIGTEFLTWLWYFSEDKGGMNSGFAYALEGPFTFVHEGEGAHEIIVRKGNPGIASEAKSALMAGKKLLKAKLTIARGDEQWTCLLNGSEWTFGSLKMPKGERLDPASVLDERMLSIGTFFEAFENLYRVFLAIRKDPKAWEDEVSCIRQWVADRVSQA